MPTYREARLASIDFTDHDNDSDLNDDEASPAPHILSQTRSPNLSSNPLNVQTSPALSMSNNSADLHKLEQQRCLQKTNTLDRATNIASRGPRELGGVTTCTTGSYHGDTDNSISRRAVDSGEQGVQMRSNNGLQKRPQSQIVMGSARSGNLAGGGGITSKIFGGRSEKRMICCVGMLDGSEAKFEVCKSAPGQVLFDMVCVSLDLLEKQYFGISYRDHDNNWYWLNNVKSVSKNISKSVSTLEFQVKYYPADVKSLKEELTRYYFCLQLRQDLAIGKLPCSFLSYAILGSYVVQSELGDYENQQQAVTSSNTAVISPVDYIRNYMFAPDTTASYNEELLFKIAELHRLHRGLTPEEADLCFLENAKKLSLYGVNLHAVIHNQSGEAQMIGVYHTGLVVYRDRLRICRYPWPRLTKLSYKKNLFYVHSRAGDSKLEEKVVDYKCKSAKLARRLWKLCVEHHSFFRLREPDNPRKPHRFPTFGTGRFRYTGATYQQIRSSPVGRAPPAFKRISTLRKSMFVPSSTTDDSDNNNATDLTNSGQSKRPVSSPPDVLLMMQDKDDDLDIDEQPESTPAIAPKVTSPQFSACPKSNIKSNMITNSNPVYIAPPTSRFILPCDTLTLSHTDITPFQDRLNIIHDANTDLEIITLAACEERCINCNWLSVRTTHGVSRPQSYFYEIKIISANDKSPLLLRVGWASSKASLDLGLDAEGYAFISTGQVLNSNIGRDYGAHLFQVGDVIGCFLDLDQANGQISFSYNGQFLGQAFHFVLKQSNASYFAVISLGGSETISVSVNFRGEVTPFYYSLLEEMGCYIPLAMESVEFCCVNSTQEWCINPHDVTPAIKLGGNNLYVQANYGCGWQGSRANRGVISNGVNGSNRFYYEVKIVELCGSQALARVGWGKISERNLLGGIVGCLDLGADGASWGYGADWDGFNLGGGNKRAKKLHANEIENYGELFECGDVIGCFLDLDTGSISWSKNGVLYGEAYHLSTADLSVLNSSVRTVFLPMANLRDSTLAFNFGYTQFRYTPEPPFRALCKATGDQVILSGKKTPGSVCPQPENRRAKAGGWTYNVDPIALEKLLEQQSKRQSQINTETAISDSKIINVTSVPKPLKIAPTFTTDLNNNPNNEIASAPVVNQHKALNALQSAPPIMTNNRDYASLNEQQQNVCVNAVMLHTKPANGANEDKGDVELNDKCSTLIENNHMVTNDNMSHQQAPMKSKMANNSSNEHGKQLTVARKISRTSLSAVSEGSPARSIGDVVTNPLVQYEELDFSHVPTVETRTCRYNNNSNQHDNDLLSHNLHNDVAISPCYNNNDNDDVTVPTVVTKTHYFRYMAEDVNDLEPAIAMLTNSVHRRDSSGRVLETTTFSSIHSDNIREATVITTVKLESEETYHTRIIANAVLSVTGLSPNVSADIEDYGRLVEDFPYRNEV